MPLRLVTWNINSLRVREDQVLRFLADAEPDVLCLQETKLTDDLFPADALADAGYPHQLIWGEKTYNGVAIVSRKALADPHIGFHDDLEDDPQARCVQATVDGVRIVNCYVPNGGTVGSPKFRYKLKWLRRLRKELDRTTSADQPVAVVGDYNIAPADADVHDPFAGEGRILFHPDEHRHLKKVMGFGLSDALRHVHPTGHFFTWWSYQQIAFSKNWGYRIDHILVTQPLVDRLTDVITRQDVRGWDQPSDHCPVVADFA